MLLPISEIPEILKKDCALACNQAHPLLNNESMASNPPPAVISVRRHPFTSTEGRRLVELLDADLASLYPDWDDLAHPGMQHGNDPRPAVKQINGLFEPPSTRLRNGPVRVAELKAANRTLEQEELSASLVFFVAFKSSSFAEDVEEAIGCGAIRLFNPSKPLPPGLSPNSKYAEVKRMYVHPSARGLGISKLVLAEIERYAKDELNLDVLVMETGLNQAPAVRLYEGAGYTRRSMFGEYVGADVQSGGDSVCLERSLRYSGISFGHWSPYQLRPKEPVH